MFALETIEKGKESDLIHPIRI